MLQAETASLPGLVLSTSSPSARGATRRWASVEELMREVTNARIYDGARFRTSTEVGLAMGRRIGEQAVTRMPQAAAVLKLAAN